MKKIVELKVAPKDIEDIEYLRDRIWKKLKLTSKDNWEFRLVRRSIDARGNNPLFLLKFDVYVNEEIPQEPKIVKYQKPVNSAERVIIVGAGPAGYFAALKLLELGYIPVVLDRGKDVQSRRRDLKAIQQYGIVNPHSNYCFGEGGAGTYSDGKLYTRSQKRGKIIDVLRILVEHGAQEDILIDAHPHIGSNKLPKIVAAIRESIERLGGEIHFDTCVSDFIIENKRILGAVSEEGKIYKGKAVILATGHSARDIYYLLDRKGITLEKKPFALGVRIEHPQRLIDEIQYGQKVREENLPASSYKLTCQVENKGVFSFCMCPGGLIVPASTAPGELVVNGMSLSRRDSPFANSGFVTAIDIDEMEELGYTGLWGHLDFQKEVEKIMFNYGDGTQKAPAQRITDFVNNRLSCDLPGSSYIPGIFSAPMHELLPQFIAKRLQEAVKIFGRKMKGYYTEEAQIVGVESRTSSPIRIPRDKDSYQHADVIGLFPCGEGAGYAGGILSAAMDGQNVAKAVGLFLKPG
jgi:uncharacterized FAD-dependent dehydrogenase